MSYFLSIDLLQFIAVIIRGRYFIIITIESNSIQIKILELELY